MATRIRFDSTHNVETPTFILATRNGRKLGKLPAYNIVFSNKENSAKELTFKVNKVNCTGAETASKTIRVTPINIHCALNALDGYQLLRTMEAANYKELYEYCLVSSHITNSLLTFKGENGTHQRTAIAYSIDQDGTIFLTGEDADAVLLKMTSDAKLYINNASIIGLSVGEGFTITLSMNVPASITSNRFWNQIRDFKLVYCKEYDQWFEMYVKVEEDNQLIKTISCVSLGEAELGQILLHEIEINTELDIDRDDYEPTIIYDSENTLASLLDRMLEKAPHYRIKHVDYSIARLQRTFTFDNTSIYDALQDVANEVECLVHVDCVNNGSGGIDRSISLYDLQSFCLDCGYRGEMDRVCPQCGGVDIQRGYGKDTSIFISVENLADDITYTTDTDSVKNCFKLEGGDDLMTATIANCNPNGSSYLWYISDAQREDMSEELQAKLKAYDDLFDYYESEYEFIPDETVRSAYNEIVEEYRTYKDSLAVIPESIVGYPALMSAYYDTIDFELFLRNELMPEVTIQTTTAALEGAKLNVLSMTPVAVSNIDTVSGTTASNAVLSLARCAVDPRYQVKVKEYTFVGSTWRGVFTVTNSGDEEDTANTNYISFELTNDQETYIVQNLRKTLSKSSDEAFDIASIFSQDSDAFSATMKTFCLNRLSAFRDAAQSAIDLLIRQGIADQATWASSQRNLYDAIYTPYYDKLQIIDNEIATREAEIATVVGTTDLYGGISSYGMRTLIDSTREAIGRALDFESFIGTKLWLEFAAYRREDTYQNSNYISDGLDNLQLFEMAQAFIESAKKEIAKSSTEQHSISATLKNLLVMKEFTAILDNFEIGNWLRLRIDDVVYKLRLIEYEIDYDNLDKLDVVFSDVKISEFGMSDIESVLNAASSMSTSYGGVMRQASRGDQSRSLLENWVENGLALTKMKIIDSTENQNVVYDEHGILCRELNPETELYDEKQLKILNKGLYVTDDNWRTSKAGIGDFVFWNPETRQMEEHYGVIADTLVGHLILGEHVGIYNMDNSVVIGKEGLVITTEPSDTDDEQRLFTVRRKTIDDDGNESYEPIMYINDDGYVVLNGQISINSTGSGGSITPLSALRNDISTIQNQITQIQTGDNGIDILISRIQTLETNRDATYDSVTTSTGYTFDADGLTIRKSDSEMENLLNNDGMYVRRWTGGTYDDILTADKDGVYAINVKAEQYLIIGNNSR